MADDVDAAETHLSKGSSPFHQVRLPAPFRHILLEAYIRAVRERRSYLHAGNARLRAGNNARRSDLSARNIRDYGLITLIT